MNERGTKHYKMTNAEVVARETVLQPGVHQLTQTSARSHQGDILMDNLLNNPPFLLFLPTPQTAAVAFALYRYYTV